MRILFIIPARKGSKRLKDKNKRHFNGKPLVCHSIDFAKKVLTQHDTLCVTTDDQEILAFARREKVDLIIDRPSHLASDSATSYDVIFHACVTAKELQKEVDTIVLLQPTTPFRSERDFEMMKEFYSNNRMKSLASIGNKISESKNKVNYNSYTMKRTNESIAAEGYLNGSIYFFDYEALTKDQESLEFEEVHYYLMSDKNSIDIDTWEDWNIANDYL